MIEASCHCGDVRLRIETAPETVNNCQCSICRRYGALWAYYHPSQVQIALSGAATDTYIWGDREIMFHRCARCGCVTHWSGVPPEPKPERLGVNARLMAPDVLAGAVVLRNGQPVSGPQTPP
ncbi:hypothetical protein L2D01_00420 [Hyphomonadaceae bacterium ML37]|nr:hypothetical protein L2D01_00420 [Hyphomonadaceae bacterium ML37]